MMRERLAVLLLLLGAALALWALWGQPESVGEAFAHPWNWIIGTEQSLNIRLLEVSENAAPVKAASRRLLQPFGVVRLVQTYPAPAGSPRTPGVTVSTPTAVAPSPANSASPR